MRTINFPEHMSRMTLLGLAIIYFMPSVFSMQLRAPAINLANTFLTCFAHFFAVGLRNSSPRRHRPPLAEAVTITHNPIAWRAVVHRVTYTLDNHQELSSKAIFAPFGVLRNVQHIRTL